MSEAMKALSIIWGIIAAVCFIGILTGATHHWITCLGSSVMCVCMWPKAEEDER